MLMWYERLTQMLPIAHQPVRVQGIGEDTPNNMFSFINFEPLELYWTYFLTLQTTTPKIPPMRLMSQKWDVVAWARTMGLDEIISPWVLDHGLRHHFCEYGIFWALKQILPKFMVMVTWCGSSMKWGHVVWKICPQHFTKYLALMDLF